MNDMPMPLPEAVIERALQGYAPEDSQQAAALVSGLLSVLPLEEPERVADATLRSLPQCDHIT